MNEVKIVDGHGNEIEEGKRKELAKELKGLTENFTKDVKKLAEKYEVKLVTRVAFTSVE